MFFFLTWDNFYYKLMKRIIVHVFILLMFTLTLQIHAPITSAQSKLAKKTTTIKTGQPNSTEYLLFMDELNKITNEAGFVLRTLQLGFGKKFADLIDNFKKYNTGLEAIRKVLKKFHLYIHKKAKLCPKPPFNKTEIYRYINFTEQKQKAIMKQVDGNSQFDKMKENIKKMKELSDSYLSYVKQTIEGSFCNIPRPIKVDNGSIKQKKEKLYYKNNLDVSNWYYGSTNQLKYKAYLLKKAANFKLTTCPTELPYVRDDEQKCFNCPPGSIYNLGAEKCDSCPPGKMLNVATGHCQPCFGQMFIINHQFVCKACALESQQLFDPKTGKCYKCKDTEYLDATARACKPIKCPADQPKFNRQLELCQKCKQDEVINPNNPTVCVFRCPKQKPFYNKQTKVCMECGKNQAYAAESKSCKKIQLSPSDSESNEGQTSNQNPQSSQQNKLHQTEPQKPQVPHLQAQSRTVVVVASNPLPNSQAKSTKAVAKKAIDSDIKGMSGKVQQMHAFKVNG